MRRQILFPAMFLLGVSGRPPLADDARIGFDYGAEAVVPAQKLSFTRKPKPAVRGRRDEGSPGSAVLSLEEFIRLVPSRYGGHGFGRLLKGRAGMGQESGGSPGGESEWWAEAVLVFTSLRERLSQAHEDQAGSGDYGGQEGVGFGLHYGVLSADGLILFLLHLKCKARARRRFDRVARG